MPLKKLEKELEDVELAKKEEQEESKTPRELFEKVVKFTNEARKQYGNIIKSVLIFGSAVKGQMIEGSDADVWVILDDTATKSSEDLNKVNSQLYLIAHELKDLHIQATPLTQFWEWIRMGSPELVNYLRSGLIIYDSGFIKPVQKMLQMGLIPPSQESITLRARTADVRYKRVVLDIKAMIFDLRYCATDIIQAVVMYFYKAQPDQKAIPEYLERLVKEKNLEPKYIEKFKELDKLWKDIDHKITKDVTAEHLEKALKLSREIIDRFKEFLPEHLREEEEPKEGW